MSKSKEVLVKDVARSISVTHKKSKESLIFLNTSDIEHGSILHSNYSLVSTWPGQAKKSIRRNDILFSEIRPANGRWAYIDFEADDYVVSTKLMVIRVDENVILPTYFYKWLTSNGTVSRLQSLAESRSGTFPQITFDDIGFLKIPLPSIDEQKSVASTLAALDDKIELNRRMNETLEAMAHAIFRDWFVDFGPVRRKMAGVTDPCIILGGLLPPSSKVTQLANLFPDRLGPDDFPEGWISDTLGNHFSVLETGKRPKGGSVISGMPSVGAESIKGVGIFDFTKTKFVPTQFFQKMRSGICEDQDVLVYKDGGTPGNLRPAVSFVSDGFPFERFCINEHVFRVRTNTFSQALLYCVLKSDELLRQMKEYATGVAQPGLNQSAMNRLSFVRPVDLQLFREAAQIVDPLIVGCNKLAAQSRALSETRDYLLPRLMSGVVSVSLPETSNC